MKNPDIKIGTHAGKIWEILNEHGDLATHHLQEIGTLKTEDVAAALGWLAREDKICKHNDMYQLGPTNLTSSIGKNAGAVWMALHVWEPVDIEKLPILTRLTVEEVAAALGWLAREGKIILKEENNQTIIELQ